VERSRRRCKGPRTSHIAGTFGDLSTEKKRYKLVCYGPGSFDQAKENEARRIAWKRCRTSHDIPDSALPGKQSSVQMIAAL
jgi:hypothetical protein